MSIFLPPATRALILATVAVFLLQLAIGAPMEIWFALWPLGSRLFEPWQLITYAFLHDRQLLAHILFNMFAVFMFGRALEDYWGARRFLIFYLICAFTAALTELVVERVTGEGGPVLGASGSVFGLLLAFAWYFPRQRVILLLLPIPLPAWLFVSLYGVMELFLGVTGQQQGVAHFAHLGGMLGGLLCILYWRTRAPQRRW